MSQMKISSTGWLTISLSNGSASVFDLNDIGTWQYLQTELSNDENNVYRRHLLKFSPNGQILVWNCSAKQINVYIQSDLEKTEAWWVLLQIIVLKNPTSALDLTNEFLLVADINGDVYQVDFSLNKKNENLVITPENCIMKNPSNLLDLTLLRINEKKSFLLTTDQNPQIRLSHYPNTSSLEGTCFGHTEFISHIKLIDHHHILSASGDGTIRLWRLPDCIPLVLFHSKAFVLLSKQIFYTQLCNSNNNTYLENYRLDAMPEEYPLNSSSIIDYSIWKMDIVPSHSNVYIAFSIYAHRFHSIYLTNLSNLKQLNNQQRKLTLDISYGTIVDYTFPSKDYFFQSGMKNCYLYIFFDSNILLQVNILPILACDQTVFFAKSDETIQEINNILTRKEFQLINLNNNFITSDESLFQGLIQSQTDSNNSPCYKRKTGEMEQEQRKKQASSPHNEDDESLFEYL